MPTRPETFISIDIEAAGPHPAEYSMLSIGACLVDDPAAGFYVEIQPEKSASRESALAVGSLTLEHLAKNGVPAVDAMTRFDAWVGEVVPVGNAPVFVGFNAPFDWMFVEDAFQRHLGRNPFGHSAFDIKSYALGVLGGTWADTRMSALSPRYLGGRALTHNALQDARDQAELFRLIRADAVRSAE